MSSLKNAVNDWRAGYDETAINQNNPAYIGAILDTNGNFHTGGGIYDPSAEPGNYKIYDFNWYAGQGVNPDDEENGGSKFVVNSVDGFSWNTTFDNSTGLLQFVTSGSLNSLHLGHSASGDNGAAPGSADTLTEFDMTYPLLAVHGFDIAVNYAASLFGAADGNSAIAVSATASDGTALSSILANSYLYDSVNASAQKVA